MIQIDVGAILTSDTEWVFQEFLSVHPGAVYFYNSVRKEYSCHKACARQSFQEYLLNAFHDNKDRILEFWNLLLQFDTQPDDWKIQECLEALGVYQKQKEEKPKTDFSEFLQGLMEKGDILKITLPKPE